MKNITLASLLSLSLCSTAFASFNTSNIDLGSGSMGPKSSLSFTLDQLAAHVAYNIYCDVSFNQYADADVRVNVYQYSLDDQIFYSNVMKLQKDHYAQGYKFNVLVGNTETEMKSLDFLNLDDTVTVNISNCVAKVG